MANKILIAYASKYGATKEIAEKIGQVIQEKGFQTVVLPINNVEDVNFYNAVVLGSAVYIGQWQKEAVKFMKNNEKLLTGRPVWIFSSGPTEEISESSTMKDWLFPKNLQSVINRVQPRDIKVFRGKADIRKMNFVERLMIKMVKAPFGDFRDWDNITAWAGVIADELTPSNNDGFPLK